MGWWKQKTKPPYTLPGGQVYKATLRANGKPVAVKVQRPGVLETVSLDLHLARELGYQMKKAGRVLFLVSSRTSGALTQ